jgi:hypothetical protein
MQGKAVAVVTDGGERINRESHNDPMLRTNGIPDLRRAPATEPPCNLVHPPGANAFGALSKCTKNLMPDASFLGPRFVGLASC